MTATFHAVGNGEQTSTQASFSITTTISTGDFLVVVSSWDSASITTPTVATTGGTGSDTGTLILGPITAASFGAKYAAWLIPSVGAGRTGVTVSWASSSPSFADGYCWSASGLTTPTLDKSPHTDGNSTNPSSGSTGTLSTNDQFAVSYAAAASTTIGVPGGGFTDDGNTGSTGSRAGHQVVAATTALTGSFTAATSAWLALALTIKAGGAVQQPFTQTDQSKSRRIPRTSYDLSTPLNLNLFKNPIPILNVTGLTSGWGVYDLPVPQQPYNSALYTVTVVANPFNQTNWSVSSRPLPSKTIDQALNINLFTNPIPIFNGDGSTSKINPDWAPAPPPPLNINLFTNPIPIFNQFVASFSAARLPLVDTPYNQSLYSVTVSAQPFLNQLTTSFPVADIPAPQQPYNPNLYQVVVSAQPFNQTYWPPSIPIPSAPVDFYNLVIFQLSYPFNQTDWSVPARPHFVTAQDQSYNPNLYTTVANPYPFQNINLALTPTRSFPLLDAPYNQALYSTPATPLPFNTYDYPRAVRVQVAPYDLSLGLNTNLFNNPIPIFNYAYPTQHAQPPSLLDGSIGFQILNIPVVASTLIQRTLTGVGL